jgi:hypothetical protein
MLLPSIIDTQHTAGNVPCSPPRRNRRFSAAAAAGPQNSNQAPAGGRKKDSMFGGFKASKLKAGA